MRLESRVFMRRVFSNVDVVFSAALVALTLSIGASPVEAQNFSSGSDGSDGALAPSGPSGTVVLFDPAKFHGTQVGANIFNFTTITIPSGVTVRLSGNIFYDDLGQLTRVIDASGNEIDYIYDAVGNIIEVRRSSAPVPGTLAILSFTPQQGTVGGTVTILGQGFGAIGPL